MLVRKIDIVDQIALAVTPIGNRLYRLAVDTTLKAYTDEGVLKLSLRKGFITNFRSGGVLVDGFVDQIGDEKKALCYLFHDAFYTPCQAFDYHHPVSRDFADEFLRAALVWAGMGKFKAGVVYESVHWFGKSAYDDDDALTSTNAKLFNFEWGDR